MEDGVGEGFFLKEESYFLEVDPIRKKIFVKRKKKKHFKLITPEPFDFSNTEIGNNGRRNGKAFEKHRNCGKKKPNKTHVSTLIYSMGSEAKIYIAGIFFLTTRRRKCVRQRFGKIQCPFHAWKGKHFIFEFNYQENQWKRISRISRIILKKWPNQWPSCDRISKWSPIRKTAIILYLKVEKPMEVARSCEQIKSQIEEINEKHFDELNTQRNLRHTKLKIWKLH